MKYQKYGKPDYWEYFSFSSAIVNHVCPICGSPKEHYCAAQDGRKIWPPHMARCLELTDEQRTPTKILCGGVDLNVGV